MREHPPIDPVEFSRCVALVADKIDALAARAGVPDTSRGTLESTLLALSESCRRRVVIRLELVAVEALDDHSAMAVAAREVLALAKDVSASTGQSSEASSGR
jgi:hypothetical protein